MNNLHRISAITLVTALSGVGAVQADSTTHTQDYWDNHQIRDIRDVDGLRQVFVDVSNTGWTQVNTTRTSVPGGRRIDRGQTTTEDTQVKIVFR